jgi:hypothetical protein
VLDRPIFAGPDAPEIYFLTESENPTRAIIDFLDHSGSARGDELVRLLAERRVPVVVLNHVPEQSPALQSAIVARLRSMYRSSERVGRFEVRWLQTGR